MRWQMRRAGLMALTVGLGVGGSLVGLGCQPDAAPPTIEGKTPADYREEAETLAGRPVPDTPGKARPRAR